MSSLCKVATGLIASGFILSTVTSNPASAFQLYDATADFSAESNQDVNGVWSYRQGLNSSTLLNSVQTGNNRIRWQGTYSSQYGDFPYIIKNTSGGTLAPYNWTPNLLNMHPSRNGTRSVLRWTAPSAGEWKVFGYFQEITNPTSDVSIWHGSDNIFSGYVDGRNSNPVSFDINILADAGDIIEFAVGTSGNGWGADSVGLSAKIQSVQAEPVPEPGLGVLSILGIVATIGVAGKRVEPSRKR